MTTPKNIAEENSVEIPDADDEQNTETNGEPVPGENETQTPEPRKPASTGKRPLGTKEVIPFEWKLVGVSQGFALTLFKAVSLADVEAQHERVKREGYYTDLRILGIDEKVKQPKPIKPPKEAKAPRKKKAAKAVKRTPAKKVTVKAKVKAKAKRTRKAPAKAAPASGKKSAKAATAKSAKKKKKAAPAKSGKRKTAKKKN